MSYQITYRKRASKEYLNSLHWYKGRSLDAARSFIESINETLSKIAADPTKFRNTHNQFHEVRTVKFPFSIVFFINKKKKTVVIVSIFHFKRNPRKKFTDNA